MCAQLTHEPIEIVHLIYRDKPYERDSKDYEFSRASVDEHWDAGLRDIRNTLEHPELAARAPRRSTACTTFDLTEAHKPRVRHPMRVPAVQSAPQ